jgi:hypothetical protein
MNSHSSLVGTPRLASSLVNLFTSVAEAETILGDLSEEFFALVASRGASFARRWYWRQTFNTIVHLFASAFRVDLWWTVSLVFGGFCLLRLFGPLPERFIFAVLQKFNVYENHFDIYVFFATYGIGIGHALRALITGSIIAMAAKGRELVVTLTLALLLSAMLIAAWLHSINSHWSAGETLVWMLWQATVPFGLLVGGILVRTWRSSRNRSLA